MNTLTTPENITVAFDFLTSSIGGPDFMAHIIANPADEPEYVACLVGEILENEEVAVTKADVRAAIEKIKAEMPLFCGLEETASTRSDKTGAWFTDSEAEAYVAAKRAEGYAIFPTDKGVSIEKGDDMEHLTDSRLLV